MPKMSFAVGRAGWRPQLNDKKPTNLFWGIAGVETNAALGPLVSIIIMNILMLVGERDI